MRSALEQYTAETVVPVAVSELEPALADAAKQRFILLSQALSGETPFEGEFSEGELRAAIQGSSWRGKLDLKLQGEEVDLKFGFPLSDLGEWQAASVIAKDIKHRAANGSLRGVFRIERGSPVLKVSRLELNGHTLEDMPRGHASDYITGALKASADGGVFPLARIDELAVRDGKLVVKLR
jgi:hypothetical protein